MNRQIGWSTESNLLWQIGNQIDRMTGVIGSSLSTFVPQSRTLTINGVTYDLSANRSWTVAGGLSGTIATGQVAFASATNTISGSNNLFWNNTNQTLGIGTTGPIVVSAGYSYLALNNSVNGGVIEFQSNGTRIATINNNASSFDIETKISAPITFGTNGSERMRLTAAGRLLIGTTTESTYLLDVNGTARVSGVTTLQVSSNAGSNPNLLVETTNGDSSILKVKNNEGSVDVSTNNGVSNFTNTNTAISIQNGNEGVRIASGSGGIGPNTSAMLDVISTTRGFLPPRMTNAQRVAISSPAVGLIVYCTDATEGLYQYINNAWVNITGVVTNRQTASYTLALGDSNDLVEMNVATANNLTVPLDSAVAFPVGTKIDIAQYGAGQTTVVATGGVTVRSAGGALKLAAQYSGATLVKIATNEWYLFGDITV